MPARGLDHARGAERGLRDQGQREIARQADTDAGKPIELFGTGYRNGFTALTFTESGSPFGGAPIVPPAEGARNVFAATFDTAGTATDISRQVRQRAEGTPMAIGTTAAVAPGAKVPEGTEFVFDVDLCDPATRAYFQRSLNDGVVNLTDATRASESLVGRTLGGPFVQARCNVVGPNDGGPSVCDVGDLVVIDRIARGQPATLLNACNAYRTP